MIDDPRITRVLKRYRKGEDLVDAAMEVTSLGAAELLKACRLAEVSQMAGPCELDDYALAHLSRVMGLSFDSSDYDYFLHAYVRDAFVASYHDDPSVTAHSTPESGPPDTIPIPAGQRWRPVRPKDGKETYVPWEFIDSDEA